MPEKIISLGNGAQELFIGCDKFNTTLVSFNFYLPLDREKTAEFALLPFILTSCGKNYPDFSKLNFSLAKLYGANLFSSAEKVGDYSLLKMGISVINDRFALDGEAITESAVNLLLDLIFNPKAENGCFAEEDLEREKRKACEHIKSEMGEKRTYARTRLIEEAFDDDLYGTPKCGTVEQVMRITGESLYKSWQTMLSRAFLRVNVISREEPHGLAERIETALSYIDRKDVTDCSKSLPSRRRMQAKRVTERMNVAQGKLCLGLTTAVPPTKEDSAALSVFCDLFGGGPYSRLFTNVREKMSLCYYCAAALIKPKGFIMVDSGIEPQNAQKAETEILRQLEIMGRGEFTDGEFESSVKGITDSLKTYRDSQSALDAWYSIRIYEDKLCTPEETAELIKGVKKESIARIARNTTLNTVYALLPEKAADADGEKEV